MFGQVFLVKSLGSEKLQVLKSSHFCLLICALGVFSLVPCLVAIIYSSLLVFWDPSKKFHRQLQNISLINFRKTDSLTNIFLPAKTQNKLFCRYFGKNSAQQNCLFPGLLSCHHRVVQARLRIVIYVHWLYQRRAILPQIAFLLWNILCNFLSFSWWASASWCCWLWFFCSCL